MVFGDTNFLLEGCVAMEYEVATCMVGTLMPALLPIIEALKKVPGAGINFGSIVLESCAYIKTLGFEDKKCKDMPGGRKFMPLNPVCVKESITSPL